MSLVLVVSTVIFLAAVVLIEVRAIREGDERRYRAPGYWFVMGGLVLLALGIAAAIDEASLMAVLLSAIGLLGVALGTTRHDVITVR